MNNLFASLLLIFSLNANSQELLPNAKLTPGDINPKVTLSELCKPNYTSGLDSEGEKVRNVPQSTKNLVFSRYKINPKSDKFEVDHLISLVLGGSNNINNLWPESYTTKPFNAHHKDVLEVKLHKLACQGKLSLEQAQKEISTDWISAYKKYVNIQ